MSIVIDARVEAPFGKRHDKSSRESLERADAVGPELGLWLTPRQPMAGRRHAHAEIADLGFVADRESRIAEAKISNEITDRGAQVKDKRADPDAQPGTGEPQMQLIRREIA